MTFISLPEGLGDTLYACPAVEAASECGPVTIESCWPQWFGHLPNVQFARPATCLLHQKNNIDELDRGGFPWVSRPVDEPIRLGYSNMDWRVSAPRAYLSQVGVDTPRVLRVPVRPDWAESAMHKLGGLSLPARYGVVQAPTVRDEWPNTARLPSLSSIEHAMRLYPELTWISPGLQSGSRWAEGRDANNVVDLAHAGLSIFEWAALVERAEIAITYSCYLLPLAAAVGVKTLCIVGGCTQSYEVVDYEIMPTVVPVEPSLGCYCGEMAHDCKKDIHPRQIQTASSCLSKQAPITGRPPTFVLTEGIGDAAFVLMKLASLAAIWRRRIPVKLPRLPSGGVSDAHRRCERFLEFMCRRHVEFLGYSSTADNGRVLQFEPQPISTYEPGQEYCLQFNKLLDRGARVGDIWPEVPTSYNFHLDSWLHASHRVTAAVGGISSDDVIVYTSSLGSNAAWEFWPEPSHWREFIETLRAAMPSGSKVIMLGTTWDAEFMRSIAGRMSNPPVVVSDMPLEDAAVLIKLAGHLFSFPSGIGILGSVMRVPTIMPLPNSLLPMAGAYTAPDDYADGTHVNCWMDSPRSLASLAAMCWWHAPALRPGAIGVEGGPLRVSRVDVPSTPCAPQLALGRAEVPVPVVIPVCSSVPPETPVEIVPPSSSTPVDTSRDQALMRIFDSRQDLQRLMRSARKTGTDVIIYLRVWGSEHGVREYPELRRWYE